MTGRHRIGSDLVPMQRPDELLGDGSSDATLNETADPEAISKNWDDANCQTLAMEFKEWFNKLTDDTKLWLIQNMGSPLPPEISASVVAAGGPSDDHLPQSDVDWLERVNNGDDI